MKFLIAVTTVAILLLAGASRLPRSFLPDLTDSLTTACTPLIPGQRASNERSAGVALKTIATAQADFRANDRDRDGVRQFWRGDVAGLHALTPPGATPIRLIDLATAAADDRPLPAFSRLVPRRSLGGYRLRALLHAGENPNSPDPNRFAYAAIPVTPGAGKRILIIDEGNSIWSCVAEGTYGIEFFPTDAELQTMWSRWG